MNGEILILKEVTEYPRVVEKIAYGLTTDCIFVKFEMSGSWRFKQSDIQSWIEDKKVSIKDRNA